MATAAIGNYVFEPKDKVGKLSWRPGAVYRLGGSPHVLRAAGFAATGYDPRFSAILEQILPRIYGPHPDFAKIDWKQGRMVSNRSKPWRP